jgi:hypothetical protein
LERTGAPRSNTQHGTGANFRRASIGGAVVREHVDNCQWSLGAPTRPSPARLCGVRSDTRIRQASEVTTRNTCILYCTFPVIYCTIRLFSSFYSCSHLHARLPTNCPSPQTILPHSPSFPREPRQRSMGGNARDEIMADAGNFCGSGSQSFSTTGIPHRACLIRTYRSAQRERPTSGGFALRPFQQSHLSFLL